MVILKPQWYLQKWIVSRGGIKYSSV
jgi:hypothetical protein